MLEEQKRAVVKKAEDEAITSETNQSMRPNSDEVLKEETQVMLSNSDLSFVSLISHFLRRVTDGGRKNPHIILSILQFSTSPPPAAISASCSFLCF